MAGLTLRGVSKRFGAAAVIEGLDLEIADGEFVVFVGPSGCGKSTLLRMVAGLEPVSGGAVEIDGRVVNALTPAERGIAMVFQSYALYPHLDVYANMAFALRHAGRPRAEIDRRVRQAAEILSLTPLLTRRPKALSGGQRQRVAIGRAIVRDPALFLFDEPLSNLDAALRATMRVELLKLHQRLGATMIYVTHDQVEAMTLADRIVVMRSGRVEQVGAPMTLYAEPANRFVAGFLGGPPMNFLDGTVAEAGPHGATVAVGAARIRTPRQAPLGAAVTLGARPDALTPTAPDGAPLTARVSVLERLGGEAYLHVETPEGAALAVKTAVDAQARPGEIVGLAPSPQALHLFDADGAALPRAASRQGSSP